MAELVPTATEADWLAARRKGVTASEIAVIMGLSPWSSPYKLYHQKLGILPRDEVTPAMERGTYLEPYIAQRFAAAHPEFWASGDGKTLYRHGERSWQLATPDQLVHPIVPVDSCNCGGGLDGYGHEPRCGWDIDAPVAVAEFKTTSDMSEWGEPGTDEIPVHYRAQVLWQMDVMGLCAAYVTVLDVPRWEVREYVIEHGSTPEDADGDDASECTVCCDMLQMREAGREFLDRIERQEAPDLDWSPATIGALKALHPSVEDTEVMVGTQTASRYRAAVRNAKHWEERKKLYEAHLRERMGSARRAVTTDGEPLVRRDVYTVREHVRRESTVDKLVIIPPKKES